MPDSPDDPRVALAAERTLLAWVRIGLAMMGFGFVVARFGLFLRELHPAAVPASSGYGGSVLIGAGLVVTGVVVNVLTTFGCSVGSNAARGTGRRLCHSRSGSPS